MYRFALWCTVMFRYRFVNNVLIFSSFFAHYAIDNIGAADHLCSENNVKRKAHTLTLIA